MESIDSVLPVFIVIGVGYLLRALGLLREETSAALSKLVFYVAAPSLLFLGTSRTPLDESLNLPLLLLVTGVTVVVGLAVYAASARSSPARRGVLAQGAHRSNMVFVGLPIVANAYGDAALGPAAVFISFMVVLYNFFAVLLLTLPHQEKAHTGTAIWGRTAIGIAKNPLIIGCAAGLLASASGVVLPVSLDRSFDMVGRIALPIALLSVGAGLDFGRLRANLYPAIAVSLIKLIVYPALVYLALRVIGFSGIELEVPVMIMATPTAVVSYIMAQEMRGDETLASAVIIGSTTASLITLLGWQFFLRLI